MGSATVLRLTGTGRVDAANRLVLVGAQLVAQNPRPLGDVTITFDQSPAPVVAIPQRLDGQALTVDVGLDPHGVGPVKEPLDVTGFRISTGSTSLSYEFLLGEGTIASGIVAEVPAPLYFITLDEDIPAVRISSNLLEYEPAECGLVYLDVLGVAPGFGTAYNATLRRGAAAVLVVGSRPDPWTVLHVLSWHRHGTCSGQSAVWTQLAAWR